MRSTTCAACHRELIWDEAARWWRHWREADHDPVPELEEVERLRHLLFQVALAVTDPDQDHVDRCVTVQGIIGSAEQWRPASHGVEA